MQLIINIDPIVTLLIRILLGIVTKGTFCFTRFTPNAKKRKTIQPRRDFPYCRNGVGGPYTIRGDRAQFWRQ